MKGWTIVSALTKDPRAKHFFRGVYPSDVLVSVNVDTRHPSAYVINYDTSTKPGTHWVVCWFAGKHNTAEYFDSYGLAPPPLIKTFLRKHATSIRCNQRLIQSPLSTTCGYYCIYYVMKKARGYILSRLLIPFHRYNLHMNDRNIVSMIHPQLIKTNRCFNTRRS